MPRSLYQDATDRILVHLNSGKLPWIKPWRATAGRNQPHNAVTRRPYSGANVVMLWLNSGRFTVPAYLTYKQAKELGGHVRKGEHGTEVYFVKQCLTKPQADDSDGDSVRGYTVLRSYTVFNVEQCNDLPERITEQEAPKPRHGDERDATVDEFIKATGCNFKEVNGDRAFYNHGLDFVNVPPFESFRSASAFYATSFHELGHWTGHEKRLAREFGKRFGDLAYAAEELVAELTSAFLCAEFSIDGEDRHAAAYIQDWIRLFKHDPKAFFTAASKAQAAADYMRGKALADDTKQAA